jgi:cobalt-zinc-cadmium efflux system outer membrane protein
VPIIREVALRISWRVLLVSLAGVLPAAAATPPSALAQGGADTLTLTRRAAVDTALTRNPGLAVVREQIEQARARVVQATAFPDPSVSAATTLSGPASSVGTTLGVGLTLPFPQKFHLQGAVSGADLKAAQFSYQQLRQQTAAQTVQAYDALLVALRHLSDLTESRALAADFLQKTEARFEAGTAAKLDVLKARVDLAAAENALIANQRDIANAQATLNRLLGRPLGSPVVASDSLDVPPDLPGLDVLTARAQEARPELHGLRSEQAGAHAAATLASQYWMPDLSLGFAKNIFPDTPNSYSGSIGLTVPLFFWNHQRGEVAESRHRELELAAAYRDLSAQVDQDVRVTYATAATAFRQARYLRDELLPEARRAYEVARLSYGLGGSSALEVLDARRTLLDAESQYADALGAANDARADLERAVGAPLETASSGDTHDR